MLEMSCFVLIYSQNTGFGYLLESPHCFFKVLYTILLLMLPLKQRLHDRQIVIITNFVIVSSFGIKRLGCLYYNVPVPVSKEEEASQGLMIVMSNLCQSRPTDNFADIWVFNPIKI